LSLFKLTLRINIRAERMTPVRPKLPESQTVAVALAARQKRSLLRFTDSERAKLTAFYHFGRECIQSGSHN